MIFNEKNTILFIGDSITDCGRARPIGEGNGIGFGYVNMINAYLTTKYPKSGFRVLNTGISGDTIRHLEKRWNEDVIDLKPDFLSVYIGVNDVWRKFDSPNNPELAVGPEEFDSTYRKLLANPLNTAKKVLLITPFLAEKNKDEPMMKLLWEYIAIVKKIAKDNNYLLLDLQTVVDQYIADGIDPAMIAGDRVHPTQIGSMIIAKAFLEVCGINI